jgi:type I restriction-modification system DNA methylase subunit
MAESAIISKVWNFANVLRDDGVSYGDYLEQITYLLFLKMADGENSPTPKSLKEIKPTWTYFGLKTRA